MDRREEIIDAAVQLFHKQGYANTSMQDIADAVGLLKGSLYYHIASKEELLFEIHERFMNVLMQKGQAREDVANLTEHQRLAGLVKDLIELVRDYRSYVVVFFRERHAMTRPRWDAIHEKREAYELFVRRIIQQGQQDGTFRGDLDEKIVTFGLFGICNWTYMWYDPSGALGTEQIAQIFTSLLLDGLTPRPEPDFTLSGSHAGARYSATPQD
ncbi:MAG TPA: TetR/AcrR family transcriptional regulator [Roseiflexaceae bacterium]|nr:TetR/AcrR family transcriptional regulator [Roseiflexaceae bacterium]